MSRLSTSIIVIIVAGLICLYASVFTINEGSHGLVLRLGKLTTNNQGKVVVYDPGFHFKTPFITNVGYFDTRLQDLNVESKRVLTAEQKYVLVDYYVKWRIEDLPLYYKRTLGQATQAQTLLKQKINDELRALFGKRTISEVVSGQRSDIMSMLKKRANQSAHGLGIEVIDARVMGIELPKQVQSSVFSRMSTQREQVATNLRSQGRAVAEAIQAQADAQVTIAIATAKAKAQQTRADGDAKAAAIYAKAYQKDSEFYAFYRSLLAYQQAFSHKGDVMVLSPKSPFFKYFDQAGSTINKR